MLLEHLIVGLKKLNKEELNFQVSKLPDDEKLLLALLFFENLSLTEAASLLDRPKEIIQDEFVSALRKIVVFNVKGVANEEI